MINENLKKRILELKLHGIIANWEMYYKQPWLEQLIIDEEKEKYSRGLARRLRQAKLHHFKPMSEFDWKWPEKIDRIQIEDIFSLTFISKKTNIIFVGPNGVGKTMILKNLVHQSVLSGKTGVFITASEMLNDLASKEGSLARRRCLMKYVRPQLLAIDEIGYLSFDNRYADLLFEVINYRHEQSPTIITTNKPFAEWNEVFPSATCVVTLIDRLIHNSEIINIKADSYRLKESKENAEKQRRKRKGIKKK
jgi:DNA replication protein DnaC